MKQKQIATLLLVLTAGAMLLACETDNSSAGKRKLSIVTSFYPMYEFTRQVAGDRAEVSIIVDGGSDPHHFEPSAQDVALVSESDLFVYSSSEMEFWAESLLNTVEKDAALILSVAKNLNQSGAHENHEAEEIMLQGIATHYHTGDTIELTAEMEEATLLDHWHWFTREDEYGEWQAIEGQFSANLLYEVPEETFELKAVLYNENHEVFAESEPVIIEVDNHEGGPSQGEENHEHYEGNEVEVAGLAGHYHNGDIITLVVEAEKEVSEWQWSIRQEEGVEWEVVPEQTTERFTAIAETESFEVKALGLNNQGDEVVHAGTITINVDNHENQDPHSWLDPVLAQKQINVIRDRLIEIDPEGEAYYTKNSTNYNKELEALDQEFQAAFANAENRVFVVQHQAFGYIAERYDLEQIAIGGLSTEVEPSPTRIAEITKLVEKHNVPVIYYQQGANSSIAQTVAAETGTETAILTDLETLPPELQKEGMGYVEAMRQNIVALKLSIN